MSSGSRASETYASEQEASEKRPAFDLYDYVMLLWRERVKLMIFTIAGLAAGLAVALLLPPIFRAEATVQVRAERAGAGMLDALAGQFGSLGSLVGAALGSEQDDRGITLATLQSRTIIQGYIENHKLLPELFDRKWDKARKRWKRDDPQFVPTSQDGFRKFKEKIFSVSDDKKTGLVIVAVEWKDPEIAVRWLNDLIGDTNRILKERTIKESEANLSYLEVQSKNTTMVELRLALSKLMEAEYKKLMIARNTEDYILRVIDPADVPKKKVRPRRTLIVGVAGAIGLMLGLAFVTVLNAMRARRMLRASSS
jgi:uncharacterized protein involved in exopolysaccharide biosynthesis